MALVVGTLIGQLSAAFQSRDWTDCATQISNAIDTYIKSGAVNTTVTGVVTPPTGPPFTLVGSGAPAGASNIVTTGLGALQSQLIAKFTNTATLWADLGPVMASAISTDVATGTVTTIVSGALTGTGIGNPGCIVDAAGLGGLISGITAAFTTQAYNIDWNACATQIANSIDTYLKAAIVTTIDNGNVPPVSWVGTGVGTIA